MQDSWTGLFYIFARYMDPELGRFISLDPELGSLSSPQTLNRYVYCVNNTLGACQTSWRKIGKRFRRLASLYRLGIEIQDASSGSSRFLARLGPLFLVLGKKPF